MHLVHKLTIDPEKPSDTEWMRKYRAHLKSAKWQRLRELVFEREGGVCQGCASEPIEHVHHCTYAHMGDELLFELIGLCINCHLRVHGTQSFKQGFK